MHTQVFKVHTLANCLYNQMCRSIFLEIITKASLACTMNMAILNVQVPLPQYSVEVEVMGVLCISLMDAHHHWMISITVRSDTPPLCSRKLLDGSWGYDHQDDHQGRKRSILWIQHKWVRVTLTLTLAQMLFMDCLHWDMINTGSKMQ